MVVIQPQQVFLRRRAAAGFRAEPCSAAEGEQWQSRQHNRYEPAASVSCIRKQTEADASAIKTLPEFISGDLSMIQRSRLEPMDA